MVKLLLSLAKANGSVRPKIVSAYIATGSEVLEKNRQFTSIQKGVKNA